MVRAPDELVKKEDGLLDARGLEGRELDFELDAKKDMSVKDVYLS